MPHAASDESVISSVTRMLLLANTADRVFPATILYNEGWLLRLALNWYSNHSPSSAPLSITQGARWYSEALLRSQFLPRPGHRPDRLSEGFTHADAVIGHVTIGQGALANCELQPDASQFVVVEAKLGSPLSQGVTNAPWYDQAARNVACIAETLCRANVRPQSLKSLRFVVAAPKAQISAGLFETALGRSSIQNKVARRVEMYEGQDRGLKVAWLHEWFEPTLQAIDIRAEAWEAILTQLRDSNPGLGKAIDDFYELCLRFNPLRNNTTRTEADSIEPARSPEGL